MLLTLDLARVAGSQADRRAADRLQRRLLHDDLKESGLLPVSGLLLKECCKAGRLCNSMPALPAARRPEGVGPAAGRHWAVGVAFKVGCSVTCQRCLLIRS